jgi:hypothetical protein
MTELPSFAFSTIHDAALQLRGAARAQAKHVPASRPPHGQGVGRVVVSKGTFCLNRSSGMGAPARRRATRHRGE